MMWRKLLLMLRTNYDGFSVHNTSKANSSWLYLFEYGNGYVRTYSGYNHVGTLYEEALAIRREVE